MSNADREHRTRISVLERKVETLEGTLADLVGEVGALTGRVDQLEAQQATNTAAIADHETRILALENPTP